MQAGEVFNSSGRPAMAVACFNAALDLCDESNEVQGYLHVARGVARSSLGDNVGAQEDLTVANTLCRDVASVKLMELINKLGKSRSP
jgi:hypothetical protein